MFDQPVPASFQVSHTELEEHLRSYGVTDCYVTGIATDICVNATAMHSMEIGFRTVLVNDACRYILSTPKWLVRCLVKLFPAKKMFYRVLPGSCFAMFCSQSWGS